MTIEYISKNRQKTKILSLIILTSGSLFILIGAFLFPRTAFLSDITAENIIRQTNRERINQGKSLLTPNRLLSQAAYEKANAIFQAQKFQHEIDGKKFSSWIKAVGYNYSQVGENLALDFVTSEGTVDAWLDSPTHKNNLLNERFKEIGVAVIDGSFDNRPTILVVQIFATPLLEDDKSAI